MTGTRPSRQFTEAAGLMSRLHALIREGRDETGEGDALRDAIQAACSGLPEEEERLVGQLSADLYALHDPPMDSPPAGDDSRAALVAAEGEQDWPKILQLLRRYPGLGTAVERAHLRARAWRALGEAEVASDFFARAIELAGVGWRPRHRHSPRQAFPSLRDVDCSRRAA